jgi:hypothetical protein
MMRMGGLGVQHGAHLHRRGVGAQDMARPVGLRRDVKRILHLARGMVRAECSAGEVVIVELHVGTFGDAKA